MIDLIVVSREPDQASPDQMRFGGRPSAPQAGFTWPVCKACHGNMQFLGQIRSKSAGTGGTKLLLLFMCQNDPGLCDEWDANSGGNKVVAVDTAGLVLAEPPSEGEVLRETSYGARIVTTEYEDYDSARIKWSEAQNLSRRNVLGQLGGVPTWVQGDETPACDSCAKPMQFVAQLEEGPEARTAMNFGGGGCAYIFECACEQPSAKMLWQS